MNPILEVSGLRVERGRTAILREINWRIEPQEHWVVLGANGSGKTSLLKALTGYLSPTAGKIALLGQRYGASDWRDLRLKIGVVTSAFAASIPPAEPALETVISGKFAQLDLWARVTRADRTAALRLLRAAGLAHLAEREWVYLSQGERQRVLIARALMARPRLLILDEPCAGLDPVAREKFLRFVDQLARGKGGANPPAMVLVTHHVEEITPAFTHALLLRGGRVVTAAPRAQALTSANLSSTFGARLKLRRTGPRYRLAFSPFSPA
jgi:iron complex transport system ATP-binding protein